MRKFVACSVVGVVVFGGALVACSGGGSSGGSQQAFCDALKKDEKVFSDLSDQSQLNDAQSLSLTTKALDDLANKAPSEIKADMQTVAKGVKNLAGVFSQLNSALSGGDVSKLSDFEKSFSDQNKGFEQSTQNVEKYAKDKCGIDLTSGSSSSSSKSSSRSSSSRSSSSNFTDFGSDLSNLSDFSSFDSLLSSLSSRFSS